MKRKNVALNEIAEERADEREKTTEGVMVGNIKNIMKNLKITAKQAMQALEIPDADQARYSAKL